MVTTDDLNNLLQMGDVLLQTEDAEGALAAYDAALALEPTNKEALMGKSESLLRLGRAEEASRYLDYAAGHYPDDAAVWQFLGTTALATGNGELGVKAFSNYQRLTGATADNLLSLAVASYFNLGLDRARHFVELALLEEPENHQAKVWQQKLAELRDKPSLLIDVGRAHCRQGRLQQGIELFRQALELNASFPARLYLARALLASGQYEEAIPHLEAALQMEPDNPEAMVDLASAHLFLDKGQQAGELYDRVLSLEANNVDALLGKGQLLFNEGDLPKAEEYVEQAFRLSPSLPEVWLLKARLLHKQGKAAQARQAADHAIALNLRSVGAWAVGEEVLRAYGKEALADLYLERVRQLEPGLVKAEAGPLSGELEEVAAEAAELDVLLPECPKFAEVCKDRAAIYTTIDELARALYYLNLVRQKCPEYEDEQLISQQGEILLTLGRPQEAQECFEHWLELNPTNAEAQEGLAAAKQMLLASS